MISAKLKINNSKTGFLIISSKQMFAHLSMNSIIIGQSEGKPVNAVRNLALWFYSHHEMDVNVTMVCQWSFGHL